MLKAVIFDMDGVLADTEPLHLQAKAEILHSFGICEAEHSASCGKSNLEFWEAYIENYDLPIKAQELDERQCRLVLSYAQMQQLQPSRGLEELLAALQSRHIKIAVASSSHSRLVIPMLDLLGIKEYFDLVVCGDRVKNLKPAPDIYKLALAGLGVSAENALCVEDTESGLLAADRAKIGKIAYKNPTTGQQNLKLADFVVSQLAEIIEVLNL